MIGYRDPDWPAQARAVTGNRGVDAAVNVVPGGATSVIEAVAGGGRLATITSDPPGQRRGITVCSIYVRPNETSCASSRHGAQTASRSFRSPPATATRAPQWSPWSSPWLAAEPLEVATGDVRAGLPGLAVLALPGAPGVTVVAVGTAGWAWCAK